LNEDLSQGLKMKTKVDVIVLNAECYVTRRVQFFTDYRLSVQFCIDWIAYTWEERSIRRTVITAIYTQCDHDIIIMHTYSM